jgi:hypothetical protein
VQAAGKTPRTEIYTISESSAPYQKDGIEGHSMIVFHGGGSIRKSLDLRCQRCRKDAEKGG